MKIFGPIKSGDSLFCRQKSRVTAFSKTQGDEDLQKFSKRQGDEDLWSIFQGDSTINSGDSLFYRQKSRSKSKNWGDRCISIRRGYREHQKYRDITVLGDFALKRLSRTDRVAAVPRLVGIGRFVYCSEKPGSLRVFRKLVCCGFCFFLIPGSTYAG